MSRTFHVVYPNDDALAPVVLEANLVDRVRARARRIQRLRRQLALDRAALAVLDVIIAPVERAYGEPTPTPERARDARHAPID